MQKLIINGGKKLEGRVRISGAKNASLPIFAATILAEGQYCLGNFPFLRDICTMAKLLHGFNISVKCSAESEFSKEKIIEPIAGMMSKDQLMIINNGGYDYEAPYELVKTMRASILALGPLLAKRKKARVSLPGGCAIGERPVNLHITALEKMGATMNVDHGYINAQCDCLKGAEITFTTITVTGTENIMMAAALAEGTTVLNNAAQEPEIIDLANFMRAMGANIKGDGTHRIIIEGVKELSPVDRYDVMPDRIEAGTFLCAVAGAGGHITIENAPIWALTAIINRLADAGLTIIKIDDTTLEAFSEKRMRAMDITTMPYPGFPTDMQAQFMAVMTKSEGTSVINETIFENRFMHVAEFKRMGADITVKDGIAIVKGVKKLSGAPVMASDLRASAGLVIGALMAENTSEVQRIYHLDRGYERFEEKLFALGADIKRSTDTAPVPQNRQTV